MNALNILDRGSYIKKSLKGVFVLHSISPCIGRSTLGKKRALSVLQFRNAKATQKETKMK